MTPEISTYLYIGSTLIAATVYYLTFKYQAKKIDILEKAIKTQSTLLDDFEKFKKLLDVDHFLKNRDLQLENQKIEMTRYFEKEAQAMGDRIVKSMNDTYVQVNKELLDMVQELAQFPLTMVIKQFPDKEKKAERDIFIQKYYPHSATKLIGFCDAYFNGDIPPNDPTQ